MLSDHTSCTVSTIREILVPFHGILLTPRYIVTLAHVSSRSYRR